jgi:hypothetical protein
MRDILMAIGLIFAFDDTSWFLDFLEGRSIAGYMIAGETYAKFAGGVLHIAAVEVELHQG